ncbi:hypothetical protein [Sulfurisphaera tokodaii]|uniref:Cobalt-precorrin 5A hydrolase n=2 Tax=Sulfurisphaera tokodaii TaxID=111955 RepID=F9VPA9_SULTO|nr:hypothetical protein [Sulfurisphaera tokodaii]BAK54756.1 hypothetical protein STK_22000 [Sulfurisphaera tokodaii str. 7]HII73066.1 hypothetical protein [Sulfurisphaera tokodaii]
MYFTRVRVIGEGEIAKNISSLLSSLGYELSSGKPNLYIIVGEMERALKFVNRKAGVIFVSEDGEYVIPLKRESKGVSFIASIISDLLNANLISTSKFSQLGLYSVEEFSWVNALYTRNKEEVKKANKKLLDKKKLYVYSDGVSLMLPEGYIRVQTPCEADIIIGEGKCNGVLLKPIKMIVGLYYIEKIPFEVLLYSVKLTMKSLYVNENRVDVILTPVNDRNVKELSRLLNAEYMVINADSCEEMLYSYGGRILLKEVNRAYGVISCLAGLYL